MRETTDLATCVKASIAKKKFNRMKIISNGKVRNTTKNNNNKHISIHNSHSFYIHFVYEFIDPIGAIKRSTERINWTHKKWTKKEETRSVATKTEINQAENERDDGGQGGARERGIERKQRLSDQFFELGRAIRDLDWIEMGFVIE